MYSILCVFSGLIIVYASGYFLLRFFDSQNHICKTEAFCLSPIFFFIFITIIYFFQSLGISILSSPKILWSFIIISWTPICFLFIKREHAGSRLSLSCLKPIATDSPINYYFVVSFLVILLLAGISAWPPPEIFYGLKGDTRRHVLFINQLLLGFTNTHYPPFGIGEYSDYPCLAHITVGFFARLLRIDVFNAYRIVHMLQAFMLPVGIFVLMHRLTHNKWISLFSMLLVSFYGGLYEVTWNSNSWFFNASIERLLPHHITRNLALSFEPYFLFLFIGYLDLKSRFHLIVLGFILGMAGLTHTYPFVFLFAFLFSCMVFFRKGVIRHALFAIMLIGIFILLIWMVPMIFRSTTDYGIDLSFFSDGLKHLEYRQIILTWDLFLKHYGFVGILALFSLPIFQSHENRNFLFALFATSMIVLFATLFKEFLIVRTPLDLPLHPMQEKFGTSFYLVCVISTSILLYSLVNIIAGRKRIRLQYGLSILLFVSISAILLGGFRSLFVFRSQMNQLNTKEKEKAPYDISLSIEKLRGLGNTKTVFCVPPSMINNFAPLTGFNELYHNTHMVFFPERLLASKILYCNKKDREYLENITSRSYPEIFLTLLEYYKITYYIHKTESRAHLPRNLNFHAIDEIRWVDGGSYTIYEIEVPEIHKKTCYPLVSTFLGSYDVFNHFVGYCPFFASQWVRPKIFSLQSRQINGLASDGVYLWMSVSNPDRIVAVDPETGTVIKSFPNPANKAGGLAWDGENLWIVDPLEKILIEVSTEGEKTGRVLKTHCPRPRGLDWDGKSFWNVNYATYQEKKDKQIFEIPKNYTVEKNNFIRCLSVSSGIAVHDGDFWVSRGPRGKLYKIDAAEKVPVRSEQIIYNNPLHRISRITWHQEKLWAYDFRNSLLIAFIPPNIFCNGSEEFAQ